MGDRWPAQDERIFLRPDPTTRVSTVSDSTDVTELDLTAITGGRSMARQLAAEGVTHIFGIPGVPPDYATNGLAAYADQIQFINARHFFWQQQIPSETKRKLFKAKRVEEEPSVGRSVNADEAKTMATKQLVTVLEGLRRMTT
jgi:hypothetical protein